MNYYFIAFIWVVAIVAVYRFLRSNYASRIPADLKNPISFLILEIPLIFLLLKFDRLYPLLEEIPVIAKGVIIGIVIIGINLPIYRVIYNFSLPKK
ncbi:MAG: hypothetical protein JWM28_660 [Chitinophagaceae bacterium]|nr:hypothetical protein [Chitinophagaceae bacterium]